MQSDGAQRWAVLERLAHEALRDPQQHWRAFWLELHPELEAWVRKPSFLARLGRDDDRCADIVLLTWEKLQERDFAKLRAYFERPRGEPRSANPFRAWLYRVFKNIGIDYLRALPEYIRHRDTEARPKAEKGSDAYWRSVCTLHSNAVAEADPGLAQATARRMLAFLDESVPVRMREAMRLAEDGAGDAVIAEALGLSEPEARRAVERGRERLRYRPAIELWCQGYSDAEIARHLQLADGAHAHRVIKAAKELLKRHFRAEPPG